MEHVRHGTQPRRPFPTGDVPRGDVVSCRFLGTLEKNILALNLPEQRRSKHGKLTTQLMHPVFSLVFKLPNLDEVYFIPYEKSPCRAHRVLYKNTALILDRQCKLHSAL